MKKKICAKCGREVLSNCLNPDCQKWREEIAKKTLRSCSAKLVSLSQKLEWGNVAGTKKNYKEIKKIKKELDNLSKEKLTESSVSQENEKLKKLCRDLTDEYISPKDREMVDSKHYIVKPCCNSRNIKLEKNGSESYFYCDYCWETDSNKFLKSLASWYLKNIHSDLLKSNLSETDKNNFLLSNEYNKVQWGIFSSQEELKKVYNKLAEKFDNYKNNINFEREQNRTEQNRTEQNRTEQNANQFNINQPELTNQVTHLKSEINQLESAPHPNQNLLKAKREELKNLENRFKESNRQSEQKDNSKLIMWMGGSLLGVGLVGLMIWSIWKGKSND